MGDSGVIEPSTLCQLLSPLRLWGGGSADEGDDLHLGDIKAKRNGGVEYFFIYSLHGKNFFFLEKSKSASPIDISIPCYNRHPRKKKAKKE